MLLVPGKWDASAGGHISAGETSQAAAARETKEEIGATGVLHYLGKIEIHDTTEKYDNRERLFYYAMKTKNTIRYQRSEVEKIARLPLDKVDAFLKTHSHTPWMGKAWEKFRFRIIKLGGN